MWESQEYPEVPRIPVRRENNLHEPSLLFHPDRDLASGLRWMS